MRTSGYLFLLFLVDVAANVVADALALISRLGWSHPKSETSAEKNAHPASAHAASANAVQILVAVTVALVCVCATAACIGVWWRTSVLDLIQRRGDPDGFSRVESDDGSMETITLDSSGDI
jgi:hypothetical protein